MRLLSYLFFALAAFVAGGAVLIYGYLTNLACGYAPGGTSCRAAPWTLEADDRFWLVLFPGAVVVLFIGLALALRRRSKTDDDRQ